MTTKVMPVADRMDSKLQLPSLRGALVRDWRSANRGIDLIASTRRGCVWCIHAGGGGVASDADRLGRTVTALAISDDPIGIVGAVLSAGTRSYQ
jgi:hypothetical protein